MTDSRTPYRILVVIQLAAALFALVFGALGHGEPGVREIDAVLAGLLLASSALVWWVLPRLPRDVGLDIAIGFGSVLAFLATATIPLPEAQFLVGIGLVGFGVFAAYFRSRRRLMVHLGVMSLAYGAGMLINPQMPTVGDYVMIVALLWGISLMVSTLVERLRLLALSDSLTGLLNRRGLEVAASTLAANAARSEVPVSVGLIDLDDFKAYNDEHGHLGGDDLLVELAAAWTGAMRAGDLIGRYGGDEFALVLPMTAASDTDEMVRRLRSRHAAPWSVGFATWAPGEDLYTALARADRDLYALKHSRIPPPRSAPATTSGPAPAPSATAETPGDAGERQVT